jgi:hypothetical protein
MPVLMIILPFAFLAYGSVLYGQEAGLIITAFGVLSWMVNDRALRLFFLYIVGWVLFAKVASIFDGTAGNVALGVGSYLIIGLAIYLGAVRFGRKRDWVFAIRCAALMQGILCCCQLLGYWPVNDALGFAFHVQREYTNLITGTLGCPNFVAPFLAISAFFFTSKWKWCLPVIVVPIFLSGSAGAVIGLLAALRCMPAR